MAYAWGIEDGLLDKLLDDFDSAPVAPKLKALLRFVHKLTVTPGEMCQADADAVFAAGWEEQALHDAIAVTARVCFMQRLVLRGLGGLNVVGGDVVEVAPQYDPTTNTAQLGAQLMFEVLCMMAAGQGSGKS